MKLIHLKETLIPTGEPLSAQGIASILQRQFGLKYEPEDVAPYVRYLNRALRDVDPEVSRHEQETKAREIWDRFVGELTHSNKRPIE